MVLPDRPGESKTATARPRTVVAVIAAAALVVGLGVLAALTSPAPEAGQTTTTAVRPSPTFDFEEFSVADIVRGPDLDWEMALTVEDVFSSGLVSHRGGVLLFASPTSPWFGRSGPVEAWSSVSGLDWESHGVVADRGWRGAIQSDGERVVAVSSPVDGRPSLMRSDDGISWNEEVIPASPPEGQSLILNSAAVNGQGAVVAGSTYFDSTSRLREYLRSDYGLDLEEMGHGWDFRDGDVHYTIQGPMGLPVLEITGSELGLTPEEIDHAAGRRTSTPVVSVWANPGGGEWIEGEIPEINWISSMWVGPDGWFVAHGWGRTGTAIARSADGLSWQTAGQTTFAPESLIRWRNGFAGIGSRPTALLLSPDAVSWELQPIQGALPIEMGWGFEHLAGGDSGIGMIATAWLGFRDEPARQPVVVVEDDVQISFDLAAGTVAVRSGDSTTRSFSTYAETVPPWVHADLSTETLSLFDDSGSKLLATLSFEELREIESAFWSSSSAEEEIHSVLLFSTDGANWWVDDFRDDIGEDAFVIGMAVTADSIVLAAVDEFYFSASNTPGFEIWTAMLP